ncbi:hypothetical protein DFR40_2449 [Azonexus fungiphilus]|uniref:Uncharacterized protein n=1 Tax=Azonexus fungiphilus TaxID=146940 RepID=A0A495VPG3_9RHOO|nr:hypothetical protein [Azonexus fungiphilus]RKT51236.1 hypothetical protein DFR40_2449 [Azonexus fungiphilus]
MKRLFLLSTLISLGYWAYQYFMPAVELTNPVFAEVRVKIREGNREIEAVLFAKAADDADCRMRAERTRQHLLDNCPKCLSRSFECKAELAPRYLKFFDDRPGNITYLSYRPASRGERDVRMIFWGLSIDEANSLCEQMRGILSPLYRGPTSCIRPTAS